MTEKHLCSVRTRVSAGGRVVIPAPFRDALGVKEGDAVIISYEDGEVRISTIDERIRRAQAMVAKLGIPRDRSIVDEFLAERAAEAERE